MQKPFVALALLASLGSAAPSLATEPGTPMNCSDLELAPGLTCTTLTEPGEGSWGAISATMLDNDGRILQRGDGSTADQLEVIGSCGGSNLVRTSLLHLVALDGARTPLVTVRWRCLDTTAEHRELVRFGALLFEAVPGSLLVQANTLCFARFGADCPGYQGGVWAARIDGFTPLADLLPPPPLPQPLCSNGLDDDGDGQTDGSDAHCKSDADNDESRP
jgi:hypothetical protein